MSDSSLYYVPAFIQPCQRDGVVGVRRLPSPVRVEARQPGRLSRIGWTRKKLDRAVSVEGSPVTVAIRLVGITDTARRSGTCRP